VGCEKFNLKYMKQFWLVSALEYLMLATFIFIVLCLFIIFVNSIINLELTKKTIQENLKLNRAVSTFDLYGTFVVYLIMATNIVIYLKEQNLI
jgi:hypothetical protein